MTYHATQRADASELERAANERGRAAAESRCREAEAEAAELSGRLHSALGRERRATEALAGTVPAASVEAQLTAQLRGFLRGCRGESRHGAGRRGTGEDDLDGQVGRRRSAAAAVL